MRWQTANMFVISLFLVCCINPDLLSCRERPGPGTTPPDPDKSPFEMCIWEWLSMCELGGLSLIFCHMCVHAQLLQSCPTLCDPIDCSPPGSSVRGILQARIPAWVAFSSPGNCPDPGLKPESLMCLLHWQVGPLPLAPPGKPHKLSKYICCSPQRTYRWFCFKTPAQ